MLFEQAFQRLIANPDAANAAAAIASAVVATAALVISVISAVVAYRTLDHQRTHDKLSVRPLGSIVYGDFEGHLYVRLENDGVGPLIVRKFRALSGSEEFSSLIEAMPDHPDEVSWTNFVEAVEGRSLSPGGSLPLIDLQLESSNSEMEYEWFRAQVRERLGHFRLEVDYTDIYGSELPQAARSLKWFHREIAGRAKV